MRLSPWLLLGLTFVAACGDGADGSGGSGGSGGGASTSTPASSGSTASSTSSASSSASTTGSSSSSSSSSASGGGGEGGGPPIDGYGALSGTCGDVDEADITDALPQYLDNAIDFTARPMFDVMLLSAGGQEIFADGNLGGSSLYSEIFAYEVLYRCEGAALLKTEGEIIYQTMGKKTDILVDIDGQRVGVSVVRAMSFPEGAPYPVMQAYDVLEGKLADILESSVNVAPQDAWPKQILAVVAQTQDHADAIEAAYAMVDAATKADTIVYVTVTEGDDDFIYYE